MNSSKITSIFLLILIILSKSDAFPRVLLAGENPTPNKDSQTADKEQNQNPDPQKPVDSQLNSSDGENIKGAVQSELTDNNTEDKKKKISKDILGNKDKTGDIKKEIDVKSKSVDIGKEENTDPSKSSSSGKSQDLKGSDDTVKNESKERDDSSQENKESKERDDLSLENSKNKDKTEDSNKSSQENNKKKVEANESNDPSKIQENSVNGKPKERNDSSNNQETGIKDDKIKESTNTTNSQRNGKSVNESKEGNGNSNNKEKVKNKEDTTETSDPSKSKEKDKKDARMKENSGPYKSEEKDKSTGKKESKDDGKIVDDKQKAKLPIENERILDKPQLDTCDISLQKCQYYELVACLQHSEIDTRKLVISVHNAGDDSLTVNITVPPAVKIDSTTLNLGKHSNQKIKISSYTTKSLKVVLNAGKGNCTIEIRIGPSIDDWFNQFPAYASQVTPTYVGCFLFISLIIVGVLFGYCKLRKREKKVNNGVQYEQLEMGNQIQSNSEVVEASTVDGWNQGWDDDWDEEEEISDSNGNLSTNGLSSRPANRRSDWDVDWDD